MTVANIAKRATALEQLAVTLEYPTSHYKRDVTDWIEQYSQEFPEAASAISLFSSAIDKHSATDLEEIYTRTFDMAPVCSPYISGHIYGDENFERGTLLTALNDRYRDENFATNGELPDHLALILRFMPHLDQEEALEMLEYCLSRPLGEMRKALEDNPYRYVIEAVQSLVHGEQQ